MKIKDFPYVFFKIVLGFLFKLWYNPKVIGKENIPKDGNIIIAGNHKHIYDQCLIIISTKRVIHYMAKKEYFDSKFAWFFKAAGCISVDRSKKDIKAVSSALHILNDGGAIGIFPEGTRNKTDKFLLPFKYGAVSMAKKTGATIVPFGLTGDYKFRSKNLCARIGKPFKVDDIDLSLANDKLYYEIKSLMEENLTTLDK